MKPYENAIQSVNHVAYRCRDAEETRHFYEDVLGLRLSSALWLKASLTGRPVNLLHIFFEMGDNSFVAFFDVPDEFDEAMFPKRSDFDLHVAMNVADLETLLAYKEKLTEAGYHVRGPSDHGFLRSIYTHDPNGYVVELTWKTDKYDEIMSDHVDNAHDILKEWQKDKGLGPAE
jgi:catechol 2,3-dioxygenase-like lactoylglutathione lyase family enzyme